MDSKEPSIIAGSDGVALKIVSKTPSGRIGVMFETRPALTTERVSNIARINEASSLSPLGLSCEVGGQVSESAVR